MDLEGVKQELIESEFLAVILAGFGNKLRPLTFNYGDEACPKSLLPVANKPILEYVLSWLEQSGIKDVLIICPESHHSTLHHHINSEVTSSLRIDLQGFQEPQDGGVGTCALLRHFSSHIARDFILLPCDFVPPTSYSLHGILNKFRVDATSGSVVLTTCWFPSHRPEKNLQPEEWGFPSITPVLYDEQAETLLYIDSADAIEYNDEDFRFRMSVLSRHPWCKLLAGYQDSHVYVCQRTVLDILCEKPHFLSFREEFLPWLCKMQYKVAGEQKYGQVIQVPSSNASQKLALRHSTNRSRAHPISCSKKRGNYAVSPIKVNTEHPSPRIGIVLLTTGALRVNSISTLFELNSRFLLNATFTLPLEPKERSLIDSKAQISVDSIIGNSTQVLERAIIKRSAIGRHCKIGKQAKIANCILFDHCVVGEGAKLDNCILGKSTRIGAMAEMIRCLTQAGYEVASGGRFFRYWMFGTLIDTRKMVDSIKNEKLEVSDWTLSTGFDTDGEKST
ncbi:hypothetical protein AX15_007074 [Amanita polypyramis BW_CC]|nr:hypothetical protein AX15_007074 [Amanita polypyramis BW_CC]